MTSRALFSGSFDPFHGGHLDVLRAAERDYGQVIIAISINPHKDWSNYMQRYHQVRRYLDESGYYHVPIVINYGLTVMCAQQFNCQILVRGYRTNDDFIYEQNLAFLNRLLGMNTRIYHGKTTLSSTKIKKHHP